MTGGRSGNLPIERVLARMEMIEWDLRACHWWEWRRRRRLESAWAIQARMVVRKFVPRYPDRG